MIRADATDYREFAAAARQVRPALARSLTAALTRAARPVADEVRASARRLPTRGGLAALVARTRVTVDTTQSGSEVVVQITGDAPGGLDLAGLDAGEVRHPTFGRSPLVRQDVPRGFWSEVMTGPLARRAATEASAAVEDVLTEMTGGRS